MWDYRAKCLRVIDGDTLVLLIDQGLFSRQQEHIRLLSVSAPELSQIGGLPSRLFTQEWVDRWSPPLKDWPLYIITEKTGATEPDEKRTFTRYIARVYDINGKSFLNEELSGFLMQHPEWGSGT